MAKRDQGEFVVFKNVEYEWVTAPNRNGIQYLTDKIENDAEKELWKEADTKRIYDHPDLHHIFAKLTEPTKEGFRKFANVWGRLGTPDHDIQIELPGMAGVFYGSSFNSWENLHQQVNCVLERGQHSQKMLNAHFPKYVKPRVLERDGKFGVHLVATTLIGAIWLQTMQVYIGAMPGDICAAPKCETWFEIDPRKRGNAKHQKYCSDACARRGQRAAKKKGGEI